MCGIVGCITQSGEAPALLVKGLKRLEYRGYDSAGIAVLTGGEITTMREVGKLKNLENSLNGSHLRGTTGLGHTRWATHGRPTQLNAHPHRDGSGKIVVVHNGIIENFRALRADLEKLGHAFASDTDSEVIAHLIQKHYAGDLTEAVRLAVRELDGTYGIGVMHADHPETLVGARKDSPLIAGVGQGGDRFLASDATAIVEHTNQIVFLEDGEIAELKRGSLRLVDLEGKVLDRKPQQITWSLAQAERGGYPHFMLKEIHEQPIVVSDALLGRLNEAAGDVDLDGLAMDDDALRAIDRIHIIACGTSWHAGHVAKFYIERIARLSVNVDYASEFRYRDPVLTDSSLVLAISQSGETADTIAALRMGKKAGCRVLGVCNVLGSTIQRECDGTIMTHAGPEIGVASTKAFVSQLVALLLFSMRLGRAREVLSKDGVRALSSELRQLPKLIEKVLATEESVRRIAMKYRNAADFLFIGRGLNYPIALEGALKLKEISYIHAEGYPAGELKHGPIALLDERMPVVALCTKSPVYEKVVSNVEEARVRDAKIIAVANDGDEHVRAVADDVIWVPETSEVTSPIINVVPLQMLAYYIARERGCDVDQPRNLAKSVTVE
jgi:glutamine---fructose-6-phosphate transaminase (isomerizing)